MLWSKSILKWVSALCVKKAKCQPVILQQPVRKTVDTETIRVRINKQGWILKEIPIKRNVPDSQVKQVALWKIVAYKGQRSIETSGKTIDDAIKNIGMTLGVIPRQS